MGYDPQICNRVLIEKGLDCCENLINQFHCNDSQITNAYHASCSDQAMYMPVQVTTCQSYGGSSKGQMKYFAGEEFFTKCGALSSSDPNGKWGPGFCYCCCSCFANGTLIAIPDGVKVIEGFQANKDEVTIVSLPQGPGSTKIELSKAMVDFSQGTDGSGAVPSIMVYLVYGENAEYETICSPNQPFLLSTGKLIRADKIIPGTMSLVDSSGKALTVKMASIGEYKGGVHHISTDVPLKMTKDKLTSPDGHLIIANGVVVGDFELQSYFSSLSDEWKTEGHENLATIGTKDYLKLNEKHIVQKLHSIVFIASNKLTAAPENSAKLTELLHKNKAVFKAYQAPELYPIPLGATELFTPSQAEDILQKSVQVPFSNPIPFYLFNSIKNQLTGFYPDIEFVYDPMNMLPNVYAFNYYDKKFIVVTGGLARIQNFNYEGLTMAIGHGVGAFKGGAPLSSYGYSGVGIADFYAFAAVSRTVWLSNPWITYGVAALEQWKMLFDFVSPKNASGNGNDPINNPSLDCRYRTIQSGLAGGNLPECAGGQPHPVLYLENAKTLSLNQVQLVFSTDLLIDSALDVTNYTLDPEVKISKAEVDSNKHFIVTLTFEKALNPSTSYQVVINPDMQSDFGKYIDKDRASTSFKTSNS